VAYNALLVERRKLLHERAGVALESMFAEQLDDYLEELAHHYRRSDNTEKAVEYLGRAGQQALQRSAYADAISNLSAGLNLVQKLRDSSERIQRELLLQMSIGPALIAVKGNAAAEVERAYARARELCERLDDPPELFPAMWGLSLMHLLRGELRKSYELAEQMLRRAQSSGDPTFLLYGHFALGSTFYFLGEFLSAREHLEIAVTLYDPQLHRLVTSRYGGGNPGVASRSFAAWTLWQLGYPDQALKRGNEALTLAQALSDSYTLAFAKGFVGFLHQLRRERRAAQEHIEGAIALCAEYGFPNISAWVSTLRGWATVEQGRDEEGIAQMQESLAAYRATGTSLNRPYLLILVAEACRETGGPHGLNALTEALAAADEHENRVWEAEIHRLKGELLLKQNDSNTAEAQGCFQRAIQIASRQAAKSLELRAAMSLARLLDKQGRRGEARTMLADIYNWFTEGFDTADLKDAKALLDELGT